MYESNYHLLAYRQRLLFKQREQIKLIKSSILRLGLPKFIVKRCQELASQENRHSSLSRIKNRCLLTNRGRSVHPSFGLSRIKLRDFSSQGKLIGLRKSSW